MASMKPLFGRHKGETIYIIGPGPSLRDLTDAQIAALARSTSLAMSTFYAWDRAWEPTYYLIPTDAALPSWAARDIVGRWPGLADRVLGSLNRPYALPDGELERSKVRFAPEGAFTHGQGIACHAVHMARLLGAKRVVLLGLEHTRFGYVDDPTRPNIHPLTEERAALDNLAGYLKRTLGLEVVDASGPTSTLKIPRIALADILPVTVP